MTAWRVPYGRGVGFHGTFVGLAGGEHSRYMRDVPHTARILMKLAF